VWEFQGNLRVNFDLCREVLPEPYSCVWFRVIGGEVCEPTAVKELAPLITAVKELASLINAWKDLASLISAAEDLASLISAAKDLASLNTAVKKHASLITALKDVASLITAAKEHASLITAAKKHASRITPLKDVAYLITAVINLIAAKEIELAQAAQRVLQIILRKLILCFLNLKAVSGTQLGVLLLKALALNLIKSGDVESNPGPSNGEDVYIATINHPYICDSACLSCRFDPKESGK